MKIAQFQSELKKELFQNGLYSQLPKPLFFINVMDVIATVMNFIVITIIKTAIAMIINIIYFCSFFISTFLYLGKTIPEKRFRKYFQIFPSVLNYRL